MRNIAQQPVNSTDVELALRAAKVAVSERETQATGSLNNLNVWLVAELQVYFKTHPEELEKFLHTLQAE